MELKTVIEIDGNFFDKKYNHITVNNKQELQKYLTQHLKNAFVRLHSHPIITLHTKLAGTVDGYNIATEPINPGLAIFVADKHKRKNGKNFVFNQLRGNIIPIHDNYVIMNCNGNQLWPPLSENAHSEVEKFANRAFGTTYTVQKVR